MIYKGIIERDWSESKAYLKFLSPAANQNTIAYKQVTSLFQGIEIREIALNKSTSSVCYQG